MRRLWELMQSPVTDVASLRRRTNLLVAAHLVLSAASLAVLVIVVCNGRLFVTLAQRSNVETLVLAFVLAFVVFLLVSTFESLCGSIVLLWVRRFLPDRGQPWMQRRAARIERDTKKVHLNVVVEGPDGGTIEIPVADDRGRLGTLRLDGGEVALVDFPVTVTHSPLKLAVNVLADVGTLDGTTSPPQIVAWGNVDSDRAEQLGAQMRAFQRLSAVLAAPLWPSVRIDEAGIAHLRDVMRAATADLREDMLLPDIEYSAEFTIPIVPEPLAFMQIRRQQTHADAVATIGSASLVVLALLAIAVWFVLVPPWVPGK